MQKEARKVVAIGLIVFMVLALGETMFYQREANVFKKVLNAAYQYGSEYLYGHSEIESSIPNLPEDNDESGQSIDKLPSIPGDTSSDKQSEEKSQSKDQKSQSKSEKSQSKDGNSQSKDGNSQSKSDSESKSDQQGDVPPSIPDNDNGGEQGMPGEQSSHGSQHATTLLYIALGVESLILMLSILYLIMTKGGNLSIREAAKSKGKIVITVVVVIVGAGAITAGCGYLTQNIINADNAAMSDMQGQSESSVEATGVVVVDGTKKDVTNADASNTADQSVVLVKNGGEANISGTINKASGDGSNNENCEFYGINSGILAQKESTANIKEAAITTAASCSNAVFATGENACIKISDSTIKTTGKRSARGLDATYGGKIEADNVTIETEGQSCATLATDRGEGTVTAKNCKLTTKGVGSPIIYSTGDISIDKTTGAASSGQVAVVEGKNKATITNSTVTCGGTGVRDGNVDGAGVFIYQSQSGDASEGVGTFTSENSNLSVSSESKYYKSVPMFFVTNTDAVINLKNSKLSFGSGTLLCALGTDEWGEAGQNGGNVEFNADNQVLQGNIFIDSMSTLNMTLKNGSTYEGTINEDKTAKELKLTLDKNSTFKLTGDCYVSSLDNADSSNSNIDFNGHKLYVNGTAIN